MFVAALTEVVSIGIVFPLLGVLTSPEHALRHSLVRPFINALNITEPKQLLIVLTVAFALAAVISGIVRAVLLWAQIRISYAIGGDFSVGVYRRTLYQPYSVHVTLNSSAVISGTSKANNIVNSTIIPILTITSSILMLLAVLIALVAIDPLVALATFLSFSGIYAVVVLFTKRRLAVSSQIISRETTLVIKALQEGLGGIRDVLIDGSQEAYCNIYRGADSRLRRASANVSIIGGAPRFGIEAAGMVLIAVLALFMAGRDEGIATAIPVLGAFALGAQRLLPILQQAYSSWTAIRGSGAALGDALELLEQPLPKNIGNPLPTPISFQQHIEIDRLMFRYANGGPMVLRGISLTIPKGSRVGIIGTTGSGKSTMLDIFMALLLPTEGKLAIDGVPITSENHRAWQAHIAHVPQAIFLADVSVAENIAFGVPPEEIDHNRVEQAAKQAKISQTIESWAAQYDTIVGERGIRLSGGQRQRIGIARALYKQADVIVLDEATSALDSETETAVMQAIEDLGETLTILIVAHRITTLSNCDQIIELADGKITRCGTYKEVFGVGK